MLLQVTITLPNFYPQKKKRTLPNKIIYIFFFSYKIQQYIFKRKVRSEHGVLTNSLECLGNVIDS